ncbi:hypothetical protein DL769_003751 [Monosporascus sp. CRB-8-3]|nr:hypothetical protein DL769_003751 [Monosporascus sp. CRB-8-3]
MAAPPKPLPALPLPFEYGQSQKENIPQLSDEELGDIVAMLKALSKGKYPRKDALPTALNAYNCRKQPRKKSWAYFHPITSLEIRKTTGHWKEYPSVDLPEELVDDLLDEREPWESIRRGEDYAHASGTAEGLREGAARNPSRYRFLCFIHEHRVPVGAGRRAVYTISVWDREWGELTWHDTYALGRRGRRDDVRRFWAAAAATSPDFARVVGGNPRGGMLMRFRTVYHAGERVGDVLREAVPPRHTLWSVAAIGVHHMNRVGDPHASIVPDRLEYFGGCGRDLLPRLFASLLRLCLQEGARVEDAAGGRSEESERFVRQFWITENLGWMRTGTRKILEAWWPGEASAWVLEALRI